MRKFHLFKIKHHYKGYIQNSKGVVGRTPRFNSDQCYLFSILKAFPKPQTILKELKVSQFLLPMTPINGNLKTNIEELDKISKTQISNVKNT